MAKKDELRRMEDDHDPEDLYLRGYGSLPKDEPIPTLPNDPSQLPKKQKKEDLQYPVDSKGRRLKDDQLA